MLILPSVRIVRLAQRSSQALAAPMSRDENPATCG
jgi:hypothetical protein